MQPTLRSNHFVPVGDVLRVLFRSRDHQLLDGLDAIGGENLMNTEMTLANSPKE